MVDEDGEEPVEPKRRGRPPLPKPIFGPASAPVSNYILLIRTVATKGYVYLENTYTQTCQFTPSVHI